MTDYEPQQGRAMPPDPSTTASDVHDVTAAVRGLAELVSDVDDLPAVLGYIAQFAMAAAPRADGAGVTLMRAGEGRPAVVAWSVTDPVVREIDHLQYDVCNEGPCLTAMSERQTQVSGSLGADVRWRRFGARVARLDVHSALALPLMVRGSVVGALNIYARARDAFSEHAVRLAEQFAVPAAVSVGNIQVLHAAHTRATQLQNALTSRGVIDQAIGIVRSRSGGTAEEAFDRLRQLSQAENVKLAVVAQRLVEESVRRARARQAPAERG